MKGLQDQDRETESVRGDSHLNKSRFKHIDVPNFESRIPSHLLNKLREEEIWLYGVLSKLEQSIEWFKTSALEQNKSLIEFDLELSRELRTLASRVYQLEQWRSIFSVRWAILISICVVFFSGLSGAVFKIIIERWVSPAPAKIVYVPVHPGSTNFMTNPPP